MDYRLKQEISRLYKLNLSSFLQPPMASTSMESPATLQAGNLFSVTGLIAVVTGGGTGIGLLMTKALVANGATVYILGRRGDVLRQAAQSIGVEAVKPVICDVTSKASLTSAVNVISADTGYINMLICNAGISGPQTHLPSSEHQISVEDFSRVNMDVSIEDYTRTFRANVVATWYTTMAFLRLLDAGNRKGNVRQKSQVVAITSIAAFNKVGNHESSSRGGSWIMTRTQQVNTAGFAYSQSKAACTHLMKNLAVALPRWEIRANMICPGRQYFELSSSFVIHCSSL
ncbi:hypothetical protein BN1723_009655 [Verticillium longisporum]|uniref:Ketoreductase (KR) domain-containing protein n=1 Tax=Verticillium longisporum TaxID=100787 RepID=A0A0G4KQX8_VERLO|nr:hypothetical protein BN1723_009655 [Verticillium longisporum]